jgi:hypothetical protein
MSAISNKWREGDMGGRVISTRRWGHDPALIAFFGQVAREPVPTGTCFIDKDEMCGLGWELADELIGVTLARANGPEIGDRSTWTLSDISNRDGFFMDIQTDVECVRVFHD